MPINEDLLARVLQDFGTRLTSIEDALNGRPGASVAETAQQQRAVSPLSGSGQQAPNRVDQTHDHSPSLVQSEPPWPEIPDRFEHLDRETADSIFSGFNSRERPEPSALSRSGIGTGQVAAEQRSRPGLDFTIEGSGRYSAAPAPDDRVAVAGSQFIRAVDDQFVQVRSEDGRLLGAMPNFPGDIERVSTQQGQQLAVGMVAVRSVVVPYNQGVDPRSIQGFIPAPGLEEGPLTTGRVGVGRNLNNADIGRRV